MIMDLTDRLDLPATFPQGAVIENQSPDLLFAMINQPGHMPQIMLGKQIQNHAPGHILIAQHIVVRVLTAFFIYLHPILPRKITVDVPATVKQHDK